MARLVRWRTRAVAPCPQFPQGKPGEWFEVEVEEHEDRFLAAEAAQMRKHERGSKAHMEHYNTLCTTMELKCMLGARMLTAAEVQALDPAATEDERTANTETLAAAERLRAAGMPIPQRVLDKMREGQTSIFDSPPQGPSPASPEPASLPPDPNVAPEAPAPPAAFPAPEATPVGAPGVYGGRVPSFTLPEAIEAFRLWRADEFGWLKTRVLLLALRRGEYHSEMLVGVPLTNRSLIGAVTNSLLGAGLLEMLNRHGEVETRISSATSRRRSNVWRLTFSGAQMAEEMMQVPELVKWAFPER